MAKPTGSVRPASFPPMEESKPYRPRFCPLSSSFRTVYRYGKAENPENLVEDEAKSGSSSPKHLSVSLTVLPHESLSSKEISSPDFLCSGVRPGYTAPVGILPRGLVVLCNLQVDTSYKNGRSSHGFHEGFPYPATIMKKYDVSRKDWKLFCSAMDDVVSPFSTESSPWFGAVKSGSKGDISELVDCVLDVVSAWDSRFFRPRGLLMRLDMPGEAKFGLTTMDIFHNKGSRGHIDK